MMKPIALEEMDKTTFSKWSRYFSFRSFRASIGNGFRFILGNLFSCF